LFSRAAKFFRIANKSTAFCSAAQRRNSELRTKALYFLQPQRKFWNRDQKQYFVQPRGENLLELRTKALFCSPRSENFGTVNKSTPIGSAAQGKFWNRSTVCIQPRREKLGIVTFVNKSTVFCSAMVLNPPHPAGGGDFDFRRWAFRFAKKLLGV
jgi:hypothetical protein